MSTIAIFLTKMISIRFLTILACISIFVISLEGIGFLHEILALNSNAVLAIGHYTLVRLPAVVVVFLPMSMLLALLIAITELTYRNEMTAIFSTGISPFGIIIKLLPLGLVVGAVHFLILDRAIPLVNPTLKSWGIGDYAKSKATENGSKAIWARSGNDLLRFGTMSKDGTSANDIIIFKRSEDGHLQQQIHAETATKAENQWQLSHVIIYSNGAEKPQNLDHLNYDAALAQFTTNAQTADPEDMSMGVLQNFIANEGYGVRPTYVYQTSWHKRLAAPLTTLVMFLLCVPMAANYRRGGGLGTLFLVGVGLGFLFFIGDGISTTMGELGVVRPWLASWSPLIIFTAIGVSLLAQTDHV